MKTLCLIAFFALATTLAHAAGIETAPVTENPAPKTVKKLPTTLEPTPTPAPAATPAPKLQSPDEIAAAFFGQLKADKVEQAYALIATQSAISDRTQDERDKMTKNTQTALDPYGPVEGVELIGEDKVGDHLLRRTYLLLTEKLPLRWKFYFYKNAAGWNLVDLRVDDALVETIDESTRPAR